MRLLKIKLNNYAGIKDLELSFNGQSKTIRGRNATGKSTMADAFAWLLTDKPMDATKKGYTPQTTDKWGNLVHNLEHSVEADLLVSDGEVTLKKVYKEKWTKKRGSAEAEKTGNVTEYYIDGVPMSKTKYSAFLEHEVGDPDLVQMLSNVNAFNSMGWKERRKVLLEVCGDVSDEDVIASDEIFEGFADMIGRHSVEDFMAKTKKTLSLINSDLKTIPERIDEANKAILEDNDEHTEEELESMVIEASEALKTLKSREAELSRPSATEQAKLDKIAEAKRALSEATMRYQKKQNEEYLAYDRKRHDAEMEAQTATMLLRDHERSIVNARRELEDTVSRRETLMREYMEIKSRVWDEGQETCPTCGQQLPPDQIADLKAKFNLETSGLLADVNRRGKEVSKDVIAALEKQISDLEAKTKELGSDKVLALQKLDKIKSEPYELIPFSKTAEYRKLTKKIADAERSDMGLFSQSVSGEELAAVTEGIERMEASISDYKAKIMTKRLIGKQKKRIEELEASKKRLSKEYEVLQRNLWLCEQFVQKKVAMVTDKINKVFRNISFKLFDVQINGGIKECCEAMVPGPNSLVPYRDANTGAKVTAGLEIIETLSRFYGIELPVFCDNYESITSDKEYDGMQLIRLVADKDYERLEMTE